MHKQEYDSIVLFPAHGDELKPKIQWIEGGLHSSLTDNINLALKFSKHVHIVACYSGKFLPDLLSRLINSTEETKNSGWKHVTGYKCAIGNERYVQNYIFRCGLWTSDDAYYRHWNLNSNCGCRGLRGAWSFISWQ
jgi:hypothetical protein